MTDIFTFAGAAVVICALLVVIKQYKPDMAVAVSAAAGVILLGAIVVQMLPVLSDIKTLVDSVGAAEHISILFKAFGICLITQFASDLCRDAGQQTVAERIDMAGRLAVLIAALPLITQVLTLSISIMDAG